MATSLTGLNVNTTYDALIKVGDNGVVGGTLKQVSDGFGNEFPMQISTTQVVITGSLSGSATSATSASYAATASFVQNAVSASFASTASFVINAQTASLALTSSTTLTTVNENFQLAIVSASGNSPIYRNNRLTYNASTNLLTNQGEIAGDFITSTGNVAAGNNISATGTGTFTGRLTANGAITTTNITASVVSASSHIITSYIDFDKTATPAFAEGRINWIDDTKTLAIDTDVNDIQIEVGHQTVVRVRNQSSATILKGRAVYMSGSSGNRPLIYTASYETDPTSASTLGLVAADISNNSNGYVVSNGIIRNVNTSMFAAGASLYLSSSGQITTASIISPLHEVRIGKVITSHATTGIIHIDVDNGYEIGELHDVIDNSTNSTHGALLVKSGSVWKDGYQLTGSYGLTGSLAVQGKITASSDVLFQNEVFLPNLGAGTKPYMVFFDTGTGKLSYEQTSSVGGGGGSSITINNNTDNNILTATGLSGQITGEPNLQYSSSVLINKGKTLFSSTGVGLNNVTHYFRPTGSDTYAGFLLTDPDGEEVFKISGDIVNSTQKVIIGDTGDAGTNTKITIDEASGSVAVTGKFRADSIRMTDVATGANNNGEFRVGSVMADSWSTTGPTMTPGRVVYLSGSSQWTDAVASSTTTSTGILGIATINTNQNEILLHGVITVSQSLAGFTNGNPVYLATSSNGTITQTVPSTVGHVARYVGYVIDSGSRQVYFNPDFTWIEL
jgi:hypothetical protein